jgi:hypothetical protein
MKNFLLLAIVAAFTVFPAMAADPPSLGNSGSPDPIPVDGGASLLAASGVGYAVKRLRAKRAAKRA